VKLSFFERKERAKEKRELVKETVGNGACLNVQFDHSLILWLKKVVQSSYTDCCFSFFDIDIDLFRLKCIKLHQKPVHNFT